MNIVILVASYPSIINSAASLYFELTESLKDMGRQFKRVAVILPGGSFTSAWR